jgi:hypothetical protein
LFLSTGARLEDPRQRIGQALDDQIGRLRLPFVVTRVDENGPTAGTSPGLDIPPTVPNHDAAGEVDAESGSRLVEQAGFRLPARAPVVVIMRADEHPIERNPTEKYVVDGGYVTPRKRPAGDIGLVRYEN